MEEKRRLTFAEICAAHRAAEKAHQVFGGTYEVHYVEPGFGKMVAYVEAYSEKKSGVRKAVVEVAEKQQFISPETITCIRKFA